MSTTLNQQMSRQLRSITNRNLLKCGKELEASIALAGLALKVAPGAAAPDCADGGQADAVPSGNLVG